MRRSQEALLKCSGGRPMTILRQEHSNLAFRDCDSLWCVLHVRLGCRTLRRAESATFERGERRGGTLLLAWRPYAAEWD